MQTPSSGHPSRRALVAGGSAALVLSGVGAAAAATRRLSFLVLRNGDKIGEQIMSFEEAGGELTARTSVELTVKLGPVPVFRYRHEATERWTQDRFASLQTETNANGKLIRVSAERDGDRIQIAPAAGAPLTAPPQTLPFTHWNRRISAAPVFNPQDGKLLRETAVGPTPGLVRLADGSSVPASKFVFRGDASIEDWYDEAGLWTGLVGRLNDGSTVEYRKL
jgi:hypothetical protein